MKVCRVMAGQVSNHPLDPSLPLCSRAQPSWLTPLWNTRSGVVCHFWSLHNPVDHWLIVVAHPGITELKVGLVRPGIPAVWFLSDSCRKISVEWSQSYAGPRFGLEATSTHCRCFPTPGCCKTAWLSQSSSFVMMHDCDKAAMLKWSGTTKDPAGRDNKNPHEKCKLM